MVLDRTSRPVGRWSDKDGRVRRRRIVRVEKHGGIAFGESRFKADDPCKAAGLGDEECDENDVFHIGGGGGGLACGGVVEGESAVPPPWG